MSATVERWVARRLVQPPAPEHFSLRHVSAETGESERTERLLVRDGDPALVAREISSAAYELARDHAAAWPGRPQLYRLGAVVKGKIEGSFPFRARAEGKLKADALADGSEPPTAGGIVAQHMRFTESAIRIALEANAETIDALRRDNMDLRATLSRDQDRRLKFIETFEELLDRSAERRLDLKRHEDESNRRNAMAAKVIEELLPPMARKLPTFLDKVLKPEGGAADVLKKVWSVLGSLPEEQRGALVRALPPEARADLESLIDAIGAQETRDIQAGGSR
jgi:hypothetical protein